MAYFLIQEPNENTQWANGKDNVARWTKGRLDNVERIDLELIRLGDDGITYVAFNVSAQMSSLNIHFSNFPAGDDYFLIFLNSTTGITYQTSSRFTILPLGSTPSTPQTDADPNVPTVTIDGGPNPTKGFATTMSSVNGALGMNVLLEGGLVRVGIAGMIVVLASVLSGLWVVNIV